MNVAVMVLSVVLAGETLTPGDHTRTLQHDGRTRSYIVHVPPKYDAKQPTPVVLVYHGGGSNAEQTIRFTGLNEKADKETFLAVYPNGTGRLERNLTWNGGTCCGYAMQNKVDDVGFTRSLLDDLATVTNVDAKRVFATGISNGGIISYRLASELSDRIAAIASVAGTMGTKTCSPKRPVPVMHFHGTNDDFLPFKGGKGKGVSGTDFYSVDHSIQAWVKANGCPEKPVVAEEPKKADDGTSVERKTYGPGKDGAEVILFTIKGGGHTWPGRDPKVQFLGKSTKNISANDLMWDFFQRHPMPTPKATGTKTSMKGWELYVWEKDGNTLFSLLEGTNRLKTDEEITQAAVKGIGAIKTKLDGLKPGEMIIPCGRRLPDVAPKEPAKAIRDYCKKIGLKVQ